MTRARNVLTPREIVEASGRLCETALRIADEKRGTPQEREWRRDAEFWSSEAFRAARSANTQGDAHARQ